MFEVLRNTQERASLLTADTAELAFMFVSNDDHQEPHDTGKPHEAGSSSRGVHSLSYRWLIAACALVIVLQVGWLFGLFWLFDRSYTEALNLATFDSTTMQALGQFGDLFGGANTLFAGLAFAGLIYTIHLQRYDLRMQNAELKEHRNELKRSANAQRGSEEALTKQVELLEDSATLSVISTLADAYTRQIDTMESGNFKGELWTAERDIASWDREEGATPLRDPLAMEEARDRGMKSARYSSYKDPEFRRSFEEWVHARRQRKRLILELEERYKELLDKDGAAARQDSNLRPAD